MDLFEYMRQENKKTEAPLASRLRPTTLDEVVGLVSTRRSRRTACTYLLRLRNP